MARYPRYMCLRYRRVEDTHRRLLIQGPRKHNSGQTATATEDNDAPGWMIRATTTSPTHPGRAGSARAYSWGANEWCGGTEVRPNRPS